MTAAIVPVDYLAEFPPPVPLADRSLAELFEIGREMLEDVERFNEAAVSADPEHRAVILASTLSARVRSRRLLRVAAEISRRVD